jgi:tetratricopeptide (TPR) repeat protein
MTSLSPSTSTGLEPLQRAFASYLKETNLYPGLTQLDCSERLGRLLLLAEHSAPEVGEPNDLLRELESAFRDIVPVVGLPDVNWAVGSALSVRIYLKLKTAAQPYAIHTFTWHPEDAARVLFPPEVSDAQAKELTAAGNGNPPAAEELGVGVTPNSSPEANGASSEAIAGAIAPTNGAVGSLAPPTVVSFSDEALALPDAAVQPPTPHPWMQRGRYWTAQGVRSLGQYWSYGLAALILVGSGAFAYALSRPCVVGSCDRLEKAAKFYDLGQAILSSSPSGDDLATAQSDIQTAIDLLTPVPTWSSHYGEAQAGLQQYQSSIASLDALIQAQAIAQEAATLSLDPPHPVERWVNVQLLWQQAVNLLEGIPAESPAFDFGQQKLREYRTNYNTIGRRIVAEEEAEANFSTAIQTGNLARQRMDTANSLAGWQLTNKEWQAAIKGLSLIPRGTMAYGEAQAQLKDYQQQLARASNRATLEEAGAHSYNQAVQAARAAAAYEAKSQWTQAAAQWRQAVASAQQIPRDTILAEEGAVLLEAYQPALANAQNRLRTAVALQTLTTTLARLCAFSATPCTVREDPSQIQVVLSSQYAEPLRRAISPPAPDGTFAFTNQITPDAQQLIEQIITVSHQVDRQVAIYDAHGGFVARYRPDLGGFVKN